mmetsp:Transcript_109632/g.349694  ORF Transcript_109632/g.349694 Transcript_109632/m.349694 type:complete len:468 (+) Transcript_109632:156-1559(+)
MARWCLAAFAFALCTPALGRQQQQRGGDALFRGSRGAAASGAGVCKGSAADPWNYMDGGFSWNAGECCMGGGQSPVNLTAVVGDESPLNAKIFYGYPALYQPVSILNDGHMLSVELGPHAGGFAVGSLYPDILTSRWRVWKIAIHVPSEHTFQGVRAPLELQLFHRRKGNKRENPAPGDVAVVSVGYTYGGRRSKLLDSLKKGGLPLEPGSWQESTQELDFSEFFGPGLMGSGGGDRSGKFWQYEGSLTAPPCSRGVQWVVRHDALPASPDSLEAFKEAIAALTPVAQAEVGNARKLQSACGRTMTLRSTSDVTPQMQLEPRAEDGGFQTAVAEALAEQKKFAAAMVPEPPKLYKECLDRLARAATDLGVAKSHRHNTCKAGAEAQAKLKTVQPGLSRVRVVEQYKGNMAKCETASAVIASLAKELSGGKARCASLKGEKPKAKDEQPMSGSVSGALSALDPSGLLR